MIDLPTLFILGAGASKPYGYPTGKELRTDIINNFLSEAEGLVKKSSLNLPEQNQFQRNAKEFVENFSKSPIDSIDKYVALNPIFSNFCKIAITLCILKKEKTSKFLEEMPYQHINEDWYRLIFNRMMTTIKHPDDFKKFGENKIAFITFNYDRSLEYFLYESFCRTFWQSRRYFEYKIKEYVPFPIVHMYGQVAEFNNLSMSTWSDWSNYREDFDNLKQVEELSKGIRVIGERSDIMKEEVKTLIADYKRIFFLGFGYASENLDALDLPAAVKDNRGIYGTAMDKTLKEIANVKLTIKNGFKSKNIPVASPEIHDMNSYDLLREYL